MSAPDHAVRELVSKAPKFVPKVPLHGNEQSALEPFKLFAASEFGSLPNLSWRVHPVLPTTGYAGLIGVSGAGKSFIALDLVAALGTGKRWFGYRVKACRVCYVALEGDAGLRRRVEAWQIQNEAPFPSEVLFMFEQFRLTNPDDVLRLAGSVQARGGADVVVIDTLNRAAPEADENSSKDMGAILEGTKHLQSLTGGLVLLVHHVGKDPSKGMRGHSSLFAALDAVIEVCHADGGREIRLAKCKDGRDGASHPFRLEVVDLGYDEDDEPIDSCVVHVESVTERPETRNKPRLPKTGNQRIVYDTLGDQFRASVHFGKAGAPAMRPCLEFDSVVDATQDRLPVEPKRRKERAQEALRGLVAKQVVRFNEGWIWLP